MKLQKEDCSLMNKLPYTYLLEEHYGTVETISKIVGVEKDFIKSATKNRAILYVSREREEVMELLLDSGFTHRHKNSVSSLGVACKGTLEIAIKDPRKQGSGGDGKSNEKMFLTQVQKYLDQGIRRVTIDSGEKEITYQNVYKAVDASYNGSFKYNKSDVDLLDENGDIVVGISIKMQGGCRWESSIRRFGPMFNKFIDRVSSKTLQDIEFVQRVDAQEGRYWMRGANGKNIGGVYITDFPTEHSRSIIFGDTKVGKVLVVEKSFRKDSFYVSNNTLTIYTHKIYRTMDDIYQDGVHPILKISKHAGKKYGMELRSVPAKDFPKTDAAEVRTVSYEELMNSL